MELWEILVPTLINDVPVRTRYHKEWDRRVYQITGGLTIMAPTKGRWISPDKVLFAERMIPVRIACSKEQIEKIIALTIEYYDQQAVMAYKISDEVIIKYKQQ